MNISNLHRYFRSETFNVIGAFGLNPWVVWWVEGAQKDELAETELMVATRNVEEPGKKGIPHIYCYSEFM